MSEFSKVSGISGLSEFSGLPRFSGLSRLFGFSGYFRELGNNKMPHLIQLEHSVEEVGILSFR